VATFPHASMQRTSSTSVATRIGSRWVLSQGAGPVGWRLAPLTVCRRAWCLTRRLVCSSAESQSAAVRQERGISVRPAVPADAEDIAGVHVRAWQAAYAGLLDDAILAGLSIAQRTVLWRERLPAEPPRTYCVALLDGVVVGFCTTLEPSRDSDAQPGTAEILSLNVDPSAWGSGAGQDLIDEALARLGAGGWTAVWLWVLDGNARAIRFYERNGFQLDGAVKVDEALNCQDLRMCRKLES
jgi:ribosomal protein S18 acetylase RimI-like enzyme